MNRHALRQQLRTQRRQLSADQRELAAGQLAKQFQAKNLFADVKHLAVYCAQDGEIDPSEIVRTAREKNILCYLPILEDKKLIFAAYHKDDPCTLNRYGISEPVQKENVITPEQLDAVLVPLVAFDQKGNRLGMGQGYYDRTFAFMNDAIKPKLIGLAYAFQEVEKIIAEEWDVPLHIVVTDR
jgi:5-formyltetrahydrofolate cyclo-ligase